MARPKSKSIDLAGEKVGLLTVLYISPSVGRDRRWVCRCECGKRAHIDEHRLIARKAKSCGCVAPVTKRGRPATLAYRSWQRMRDRCSDPANDYWHLYGGRGIKVCERWQDFEAFFADMGERPSVRHSIDRIDNNGNYEPGNCRWATAVEQMNNTRANRVIDFDGMRMSVSAWAEFTGLTAAGITGRLNRGQSAEEALLAEAKARERHKRG